MHKVQSCIYISKNDISYFSLGPAMLTPGSDSGISMTPSTPMTPRTPQTPTKIGAMTPTQVQAYTTGKTGSKSTFRSFG